MKKKIVGVKKMTVIKISELTVNELKAQLRKYGLSLSGNKDELVDRLREKSRSRRVRG